MSDSKDGGYNLVSEREDQIREFVRTNPGYYIRQFAKINSRSGFTLTFNFWAGLLGPIWYAARGLWNWALTFLIIETFALVQIVRGFFGDLAADAWDRITRIEGTLELRRQQLASAIENNSEKIDVYKRTVASLEDNIGGIRLEAQQLEETGTMVAISGIVILILVKLAQSYYANTVLEKRFSEWLSDSSIVAGMPLKHMALGAIFVTGIVIATVINYSFPGVYPFLLNLRFLSPTVKCFSTPLQWVFAGCWTVWNWCL